MGQLYAVLTEGHQARPGQPLENRRSRFSVPTGHQLGPPYPPAGVLGTLSEGGEAQEEVLGDPLLDGVQLAEDALGSPGNPATLTRARSAPNSPTSTGRGEAKRQIRATCEPCWDSQPALAGGELISD